MNVKIFQIPSVYSIWDGLSLKPSHATVPLSPLLVSMTPAVVVDSDDGASDKMSMV